MLISAIYVCNTKKSESTPLIQESDFGYKASGSRFGFPESTIICRATINFAVFSLPLLESNRIEIEQQTPSVID